MKKLLLIICVLMFSLWTIGQNITNYAFTATTGLWSPLVGGVNPTLSGTLDDGYASAIPLGFSFTYMGIPYTTCAVSTNGFLVLGGTLTTSIAANNLTSGTPRPFIAPLWDDIELAAATDITYKTNGAGGSMVFTAQWTNVYWNYTATVGSISFQVNLYQATGKVEFVYHVLAGSLISPSASIGITAMASGSGNFLSLASSGVSPAISSTSETTTISLRPAEGQIYAFTPPGGGIPANPLNLTFTAVGQTGMTLNWVDNSTNENFFVITRALDAGFTTGVVISTVASTTTATTSTPYSSVVAGLTAGTTYFFKICAAHEGASSPGITGNQATDAIIPMTGVWTIDPAGGKPSTNFTTFTNAINYLNMNGVGTGGVTFNVASGAVFNEKPPCITATGTATDQILFQKNGALANPKLTPAGTLSSSPYDYGFCISGGDYITFSGIDVDASAATTTANAIEFGYLVRNVSATNGAQYNTIKNCAVTLNKNFVATTASGCIYSSVSSTQGGVTPTNATGANSYNKFYNLTLQNAQTGLYLYGNTSYPDLAIEVGVAGAGCQMAQNIITNMGGVYTFGSAYGVYTYGLSGAKIFNNKITGISSNQAPAAGIMLASFAGTCDVYNNEVATISNIGPSSTTRAVGIEIQNSTGTPTARVYTNRVYDIKTNFTGSATASIYAYGIYCNNTSTATVSEIDNNSVYLSAPGTPTYSFACFANANASTAVHKVRGNVFVNGVGPQGATAKHVCWYSVSATAIGGTGSVSNYNDLYVSITSDASGNIGRGNTTNYQTLANWRTGVSQDANSISGDPLFTADLHATWPGLNTVSGFSPQSWVSYDMDCDHYGNTLGADNFTGIPVLPPVGLAVVVVNSQSVSITFTKNAAVNQVVIVWNYTGVFTAPSGPPPASGGFAGGTIVSNDANSPQPHTGLTGGTLYYYKAFSYDGSSYSVGVTASITTNIDAPTAFTATAATPSSVNLTWTRNLSPDNVVIARNTTNTFGTPVNGVPYVIGDPLTGGGTVAYSGPLEAWTDGSLTSNTDYFYKIWSVDAYMYYSVATGGASVRTPCDPYVLPWSENFDHMASVGVSILPDCWKAISAAGTSWISGNAASITYNDPCTAPNYVYASWNPTVSDKFLITPGFTLVSGISYDFKFNWIGDGTTGWLGDVMVNTAQTGTGATALGPSFVVITTPTTAVCTPAIRSFTPPSTGTYYFMVRVSNPTNTPWYLGFDDFELAETPTCPAPNLPTCANLTGVSADLSWTATGATDYAIEYGPAGFSPTGSPTPGFEHVTNPFTLSGLSPNTSYDYYVQSNCPGSLTSPWAGPKGFTTTQVPATLPYSETFETWPDGWSVANGTQTNQWYFGTAASAHSGVNSAYISNDGGVTNAYTITSTSVVHFYRDIVFTGGGSAGYDLKFWWKGQGEGSTTYYDYLRAYVVDPSVIPVAGTLLTAGQVGITYNLQGSYIQATISLPSSLTGTQRLVFSWRNDNSVGAQPPASIDDITLEVSNACLVPTTMTTTVITPVGGNLGWASPDSFFDIFLEVAGADPPDAGTIPTVDNYDGASNGNTYTYAAGSPATSYDWYVRTDCAAGGGTGQSSWSGPKTFRTSCLASTVNSFPLSESFTSGVVPPDSPYCWSEIITNADSNWTYDGRSPYYATVNYDVALAPQNEWLVTPNLNFTGLTNPRVSFDWMMSYYWSVSPNNNYDLNCKITTDGGATWTSLWSEAVEGVFTNFIWYRDTLSLAAYAGMPSVKLAWQYVGTDGAQAGIDHIVVEEGPLALPVISGTITDSLGVAPLASDMYIQASLPCNPNDTLSTLNGGVTYAVVGGVGTYTVHITQFTSPPVPGDQVYITFNNLATMSFEMGKVVIVPGLGTTHNVVIRRVRHVILPTFTSCITVTVPPHSTLRIHYTYVSWCGNTDVMRWDKTSHTWLSTLQWNWNWDPPRPPMYAPWAGRWRTIRNDSNSPEIYCIHNDDHYGRMEFDLILEVPVTPTSPGNKNDYAMMNMGCRNRPFPSCEFGAITGVNHVFLYNDGSSLGGFPSRLSSLGTDGVQNLTIQFETTPNVWWSNMNLTIDLVNVTTPGILQLNLLGSVYSVTINPGDTVCNFNPGGIPIPGMHEMTLSASGGLSMGIDCFNFSSVYDPAPLLVEGVSSDALCYGAPNGSISTTVTGGQTPYTYLWSNESTTSSLCCLMAGPYTVTVTDANSTIFIHSWTISQPEGIVLTGVPTDASCPTGADGSITLGVSGGTPAYRFSWSNGATTQNLSGLNPGAYTVTVTDINSCPKSDNWIVGQASAVCNTIAVAGKDDGPACYNAVATITVAGGITTYLIQAPGGDVTFIAGHNILFEPGTKVESGAKMLGKISNTFCPAPGAPLPAAVIAGTAESPMNLSNTHFTLYPNPTSGNFTLIQKGEAIYGTVKVDVYSMSGEKVMTEQMVGEKKHEFRFSDIPVGLYFVRVVADNYVETIKLIKTR
ncbi:MAG: T9SS type A sorting domain-containing protein [Bacteroidetes bacterium]|nr:T9SS type A sorting domain-containing protein [Bacteroidota bacterium]